MGTGSKGANVFPVAFLQTTETFAQDSQSVGFNIIIRPDTGTPINRMDLAGFDNGPGCSSSERSPLPLCEGKSRLSVGGSMDEPPTPRLAER